MIAWSAMKPRLKRWLIRLGLLAGCGLVLLLTGEVVWRRGWVDLYAPETRAYNPDLDAILARERPRILVLGDSFTAAPDAWPGQLGRALAPRGVDVVNLALPGTGFHEYAQRLRTFGRRLHPRLIAVATYVGNDLWNAYNPYPERSLVRRVYYGLCNRLQVLKYLNFRLVRLPVLGKLWLGDAPTEVADGPEDEPRLAKPPHYVAQYARDYPRMYTDAITLPAAASKRQLERIDDRMGTIAALARDLDAPVLLVIFPASAQVSERYYPEFYVRHGFEADPKELVGNDTVQRELARHATAHGMAVLDLLPAFRASQDVLYFLNDDHLSPRGQVRSAEWIGEHPAIQDLVGSSSPR